ncbi:MAG TPA: SDR family NAD(P)-dependent oxidoreductase [Chloroflexia bacterium]|jgi:NAD(P)-dependent dehydrogenase (short-subunit alcohol dehydrogenase family)
MSTDKNLILAGRRAVITGAGRGIGRAIALAFAEAGADVAITARTASDLEVVAREIEGMDRRGVPVVCDVTDAEQVSEMALRVKEELGRVDILVNNAGHAASHKFLGHPDELWHEMLLTNLTSVYYVSKAFAPMMVEQKWGRIINIASIAARVGDKYVAAYTAAKHGVLGLTRSLATELISHNVTVNAICPGYVDTPLTQESIGNIMARTGMDQKQAREALERMSPQKRLIGPEEIAAVAIFLAHESSKGITGQAINVDGGAVMS